MNTMETLKEKKLILKLADRPDNTDDERFKKAVELVRETMINKALLNDLEAWKHYHQGRKDGWKLESFLNSSITYWDLVKKYFGDIRDRETEWDKAKEKVNKYWEKEISKTSK